MTSLFPANFKGSAPKTKMKSVHMRGFPGGLNAVDDDLSMSTRYCVRLSNFKRTPSGAQELRFGTRWIADISSAVAGDVLDMEYFSGRIVAVTTLGEIATINSAGVVTAIWNEAIANALPGVPSGWSTGLTSIDFVPFKDTLVLHNGVDKPISISAAFAVTYLQDLATGSNVNVPIGLYGCVVSNFHVIAGVPAEKTTIYISSTGTSGVYQGDPAPNDSTSIDVGAFAPDSGAEIRGIAGYRNKLLVFFQEQTLIIELGIFDDAGVHLPKVDDALPRDYGLLGHRCILPIGSDILFADFGGVNSAKRNVVSVTSTIEGEHLSTIIDPTYRGVMGAQDEAVLLKDAFMVHDHLGNDVLTFSPDGRIFVYSVNEKLRYQSWSEFTGWSWTCGCSSALGRAFFGSGTRIYQLGNKAYGELYYGDRLHDRDKVWANSTLFTDGDLVLDSVEDQVYECLVTHTSEALGTFEEDRTSTPANWAEWRGTALAFDLEPPWQDGRDIMKTKQLRFINVVSKGTAAFTLNIYVDNKYLASDGVTVQHQPALSLAMVGNDADGFGYDDNDDENFGGGRHGGDPRLWGFPVRFKTAKFRITGTARQALSIIGLAFLFTVGNWRR